MGKRKLDKTIEKILGDLRILKSAVSYLEKPEDKKKLIDKITELEKHILKLIDEDKK